MVKSFMDIGLVSEYIKGSLPGSLRCEVNSLARKASIGVLVLGGISCMGELSPAQSSAPTSWSRCEFQARIPEPAAVRSLHRPTFLHWLEDGMVKSLSTAYSDLKRRLTSWKAHVNLDPSELSFSLFTFILYKIEA